MTFEGKPSTKCSQVGFPMNPCLTLKKGGQVYKTELGSYQVLGHLLSVQWLCDIQNTSVSVHGEKVNRRLISSWASDAVMNLLHFVFIRANLDKHSRCEL